MEKGQAGIPMIVLGSIISVMILGLLIYFVSTNEIIFQNKICTYGNCDSNIETVQNACKLACLDNNETKYCKDKITLKLGLNQPKLTETCKYFSENREEINDIIIESCPELCLNQ